MRNGMESCSILDSDWERWGLRMNSPSCGDIFDFNSPLDQLLTSRIEEANKDEKSDIFAKWMDEKVDLSILDGLESQSGLLDDLDVMIEDPTTFLENLMDWSSEILRNESDVSVSKLEKNEVKDLSTSKFNASPDSPSSKVPDENFLSPPECQQESLYVKALNFKNATTADESHKSEDINHLSKLLEKEESCLDASQLSISFNYPQLSPSTSVSSNETLDSIDSKDDSIKLETSCSSPASEASFFSKDLHICLDSISDKDFSSNNNDDLSKIKSSDSIKRKSTDLIKRKSHNYRKSVSSSGSVPPGEFKRDRKRKQNKDAATRYRQKKRKECVAIKGEESVLENRNKELKTQVEQLSNEIAYLKNLLKEAKLRVQSSKTTQNKIVQVNGCVKIGTKSTDQKKIYLMPILL